MAKKLAHISEDHSREQTVYEHLTGTAELAKQFAAAFGAEEDGYLLGLLHDIGKYSDAFQHRLDGGVRVDHSTAGAKEACAHGVGYLALAIAGHHGGIPNFGSRADTQNDATLSGRLKRDLEPYDDWKTVRGMRVFSRKLNLSGACDVVEFHKDKNGISLEGQPGFWLPYPIEYKHGREKETDADRLQLCAEAMALEEMLVCDIPAGALYYIETRRREVVPFTEELRRKTEDTAAEMNRYFARGYTPKVKPGKHCNACSLKSICLPVLCSRADPVSYLRAHIFESKEDTP